jgi:hypothetical protein
MIDDDHRAAAPDTAQQPHRFHAFARAHSGERLVQEEQARRRCERKPHFEPALFTVRKIGHRRVGTADKVDQLQRVLDVLVQSGNALNRFEQVEPELAAQLCERRNYEVFAHSQTIEQLIDLITLGQAELADIGHRHAGNVAALEQDLACGGRHLTGQHLEERALAGAVRADDAAQLAVIDDKIDVAVGREAAVMLGQRPGLQDGPTVAVGLAAARRHGRDRRLRRDLHCGRTLLVFGGQPRGRRVSGRRDFFPRSGQQRVDILEAANQSAAQEADQQHENYAQHQLPGGAEIERGLQKIAQVEPHRRPEQRPEQSAGTTDRRLHHQLPGGFEREGIRRHEALHEAEQASGKARIGGGHHEGGQLVGMDCGRRRPPALDCRGWRAARRRPANARCAAQ